MPWRLFCSRFVGQAYTVLSKSAALVVKMLQRNSLTLFTVLSKFALHGFQENLFTLWPPRLVWVVSNQRTALVSFNRFVTSSYKNFTLAESSVVGVTAYFLLFELGGMRLRAEIRVLKVGFMKKIAISLVAGSLFVFTAKAESYASGMNFVISHPTTVSAIGVYDGGTPFSSKEVVGIFNDFNGDLVGSEVVFGPGKSGTQMGGMFYEKVPTFVLSPGDYSLITIGSGGVSPGGGSHLNGGNFLGNLADDLDLPGGDRFNSGTTFDISVIEGPGSLSGPVALISPSSVVPDGGLTALLLGGSLAGLSFVRRKI